MESKVETPKKPPARRGRNVAIGLAAAVALYGLIAGLVVPPFAKKAIAGKLGERIGRTVAIDDLSFNPFTLNATVKGFRILEADRATAFASFDQLDVDGSITSVYRLAPVADEVTLTGLKVNLVRDGETHYNLSDILGRLAAAPAKKDEAKAEFSLSNIRLVNARIDFDDRPKGTKHQVTEIDIAIPFISNLPTHLKEYVQPKFSAKVNGTPLHLAGETLPFENSLATHVKVDLDALEIHRYVAYSPAELPLKVDAGKLDAHLSVRFTQAAGKNPSVDVTGKLALRGVEVSSAEQGPVAGVGTVEADIASFDPFAGTLHVSSVRMAEASAMKGAWKVPLTEAKDIKVDLLKKTARVESLASSDGVLLVKRERDGSIELPLRLAAKAPAAEASSATEASPAVWSAAIDKLTLAGYRVTVADAAVKPAATHRVTITQLEASDLSTEKGAKATVNARLGVEKAGSIEVASTVVLDPLAVNAKIDARRIDLVPFRSYVELFATVALKSANASAKGTLDMSGTGNALRVAYTGSAEIANVASTDTANREDLLNWDSVKTSGVGFKWSHDGPLELAVADIAVNKAYARVVVLPEGKINLQQLKFATASDPAAATAPAPAEPVKPRNVRIDRIIFADSRLNFTDHFIKPNYTADVGELNGSVTGLSSDPASRGVVDLKGSYDKTSAVVIAGTINPLSGNLFLDIAAKGKDIELPKLSAYSARYAGYGITQGRLTLDVKYHVEDGKLQGKNVIFLDQLTFGDKVEGPEATKLPVLFAVNLLKDSKGQINLELPISGSLEDPQFDIGGLISQVVGNLLKKAITSPFSLLTAAFGGGGGSGAAAAPGGGAAEDLAYVEFDPGRDEIGDAGEKKLEKVSKALLDRPAIKIGLSPRVDAEKDLEALRHAALLARVRAVKGGDLQEGEYPKYLKALFDREKPKREAAKEDAAKEKSAPKEPTVAEMEAALLERIEVGEDALKALGARRAEHVKGYLVGKGQLPAERVLVAAAPVETPAEGKARMSVDFTLR
jgi:hypothetical protein